MLAGALAGVAGFISTGCTYQEGRVRVESAVNALLGRSSRGPAPSSVSQADRRLQENTQLLREVFQVVLLREPYGPEEFGTFVNTLSQGATIEGIYNGFVNSEYYRKLEEKGAPADRRTIRVFAELISSFEKDLIEAKVHPTDFGFGSSYEPEKIEEAFRTASLFKLKRILGNEALKVLEAKRGKGESHDEIARWYSEWVTQMAARGVDFGLPLRNKADAEFHKQWVKTLPAEVFTDRLSWEVLNRVHRLLNVTEARTR